MGQIALVMELNKEYSPMFRCILHSCYIRKFPGPGRCGRRLRRGHVRPEGHEIAAELNKETSYPGQIVRAPVNKLWIDHRSYVVDVLKH